jgi:dihydropyrimidinase
VRLSATNRAKLDGLYPQGTIAIGSDADLVIWDEAPVTVTNAMLQDACDYTPYEGMELGAWPALTLCRGRPVYRDRALCGQGRRSRLVGYNRASGAQSRLRPPNSPGGTRAA